MPEPSATQETWGGLVSAMRPQDLPEGASPRTYDTDFLGGSWRQRAGLSSVYSFTGNSVGPNAGSAAVNTELGYANWINPTGILLDDSNYASVTIGTSGNPSGAFTAAVSSGAGAVWASPTNVNGNSGYATATFNSSGSTTYNASPSTQFATAISSFGTHTVITTLQGFGSVATSGDAVTVSMGYAVGITDGECILYASADGGVTYSLKRLWSDSDAGSFSFPISITNLSNLVLKLQSNAFSDGGIQSARIQISSVQATITTGGGALSSQVLTASSLGFTIPANATITGVKLAFNAYYDTTLPVFMLQLMDGATAIGTPQNFTLTSSSAAYHYGGNGTLWGYSGWTPATFANFAAAFTSSISSGTGDVNVNNLVVTVYYTLPAAKSDALDVTGFGFNLTSADGVVGFEVSLKGFDAGSAHVSCQMLKNGVPVGGTVTKVLPTSNSVIVYGDPNHTFGSPWTYSDVNNTNFGVRFQVTSGFGVVNLDYVTITVFYTSSLSNYNWIGSFEDEAGSIKTFALDANGEIWVEDVTNNPGILSPAGVNVPAGSYASGYTAYDREYITPSILTQGTGIPLQYAPGEWWDRISQVGPGAPPIVAAAEVAGTQVTITNIAITSNVVTLTTSTQSPAYTAGLVVTLSGLTTVTALNGLSFSILGTGLTTTQIELAFTHGDVGSTAETGVVTPQYSYPIVASPNGITQHPAQDDPDFPGHLECVLWSAGPGSKTPGNVITIYYVNAFNHPTGQDPVLTKLFNSGQPVYVYVANAPWGNGTWLVTSIGMDVPPNAEYGRYYFTYQVPTSNYQQTGAPGSATGSYQITQATITTTTPVPGLGPGYQISLSGVTNAGWDGVYTVTQSINSGTFVITQTALSGGVATYTWSLSTGVAPAAGELVTVTGTLNANGTLNVTDAVIASATGVSSGTFTVANFPTGLDYQTTVENGLGSTAGTIFTFDPGVNTVGNPAQNPIIGNSGGGLLTIVGASSGGSFPIGAGTRQAVVCFVTRNGYTTAPSSPVTFTVALGSNYIQMSNIPVGPPNVVARLIAITEAGQNGVPGANFYTQRLATTFTVGGTTYTSSALYISDNTTTTAQFTFSDYVLLNGEAIDVQGENLFNELEMGAPAWVTKYGSRMIYGGVQNKVPNFNNLSFDGGYLPSTGAVPNVPLGWVVDPDYSFVFGPANSITAFQITSNIVTFTVNNTFAVGQVVAVSGLGTGTYLNDLLYTVLTASSTQFTAAFTHADVGLTSDTGTARTEGGAISLVNSPIFGNALYISNTTGVTQGILGMLTQSAYQDAYFVPILQPNQPYSIRVTARIPSGLTTGNLVIDLVNSNGGVYGATVGTYTLPFASMDTFHQTFTGTILTGNGLNPVPSGLLLRVYLTNVAYNADCEIDRIDVYPTRQPVIPGPLASYVDNPEAIDGVTGAINVNEQNSQACYGAATIYNQLYFLKERSLLTTEDSPNLEPSQWTINQVSNRVGACGPNAFDYGDEWLITACRNGIFGFIGKSPSFISPELQGSAANSSIWASINWNAGHSIWIRNDLVTRRFYVGVPLPTPNFWLPDSPVNANPTSPNVILMCNYSGCPSYEEMVNSAPVHTTMFGDLKALDLRRKWSIWQIASPFADFVKRADALTLSLFFCNGIASGKIYQLDETLTTDDGATITPLYTTSSLPSLKMGQMIGVGAERKVWRHWTVNAGGTGQMKMVFYHNTLDDNYPFTAPLPVTLSQTAQFDYEGRLELQCQRFFAEFSMLGSGGTCEVTSLVVEGAAHAWSPRRGISG